jgi:hypothetical protein
VKKFAVLTTALAALVPGVASASVAGSLHLESSPGDYVGQGRTYDFSFPEREAMLSSKEVGTPGEANGVWVYLPPVFEPEVSFWGLSIRSPEGQRLQPGTSRAHRFNWVEPGFGGLDVSGDGRGCNETTGQFTVERVKFDPSGAIYSLRVSFEQSCESFMPPLRGTLDIEDNTDVLFLGLGAVKTSLRNGSVRVAGTVACPKFAGSVAVSGSVSQESPRGVLTSAPFQTTVNCTPDTAARWTAVAKPRRGSFHYGYTTLSVRADRPNGAHDETTWAGEITRPAGAR